MASDGSQPVEWHGKAFPYLLHHPNSIQTETYGSARLKESSHEHNRNNASQDQQRDRTGVWNGPAPNGYTDQPTHAQDAAQQRPEVTTGPQPDHIILPGGAKLPLIGLGTYKLDSAEAVEKALALGYRHIDCATIYGNQKIIGQGLKSYLSSSEDARSSLFITSKVWNDMHQPELVKASVEESLTDLGCGYLDLLLVHWPEAFVPGTTNIDTTVTLAETWSAFESMVDQSKVKYIGVSNFSLRQVEDILAIARIKPVVNQIELHPFLAQRKMVGVCSRKGVACVAYSPLGHSKNDLLEHPSVLKIAQQVNKTPAQVLLRWNVQRGVGVIPKSGSELHMKENLEGLFSWRLTWDQKAELDMLDNGKRFVDFSWHPWDDVEHGGVVKPSTVLL